jgi:6-phosphogluconolactonase
MIKNIDERRQAVIFEDNLLIPYLVDQFYLELQKAIQDKDRFNVALAGGSTPKKLYSSIAKDPRAKVTDFSKVYVYYGDERSVPLDDIDSNYKMSLDAGFKTLEKIHIFPMHAYLKTEKAASDYSAILPPFMDLIYLGMGDDGHTASLFPADPLLKVHDKNVVIGFITSKSSVRMTFTLNYINKSTHIVMLVTGEGKKQKVKEVLSSDGDYFPAFHIGTKDHMALFVLDTQAALLL